MKKSQKRFDIFNVSAAFDYDDSRTFVEYSAKNSVTQSRCFIQITHRVTANLLGTNKWIKLSIRDAVNYNQLRYSPLLYLFITKPKALNTKISLKVSNSSKVLVVIELFNYHQLGFINIPN